MEQRYDHRGSTISALSHRSGETGSPCGDPAEDPPIPGGRQSVSPLSTSMPVQPLSHLRVLWQPCSTCIKRKLAWTWILLHLSHCQPSKCQMLPLALGKHDLLPWNVTAEIHFKPHWLIGFSCFSADSDARHQRQRDHLFLFSVLSPFSIKITATSTSWKRRGK